MKISANAGALASVLALAASLCDTRTAKRIVALEAIHLKATGGTVVISANVLDYAITLAVPAEVEVLGEVAVSGSRLAALVTGFPNDVDIEIASDENITRVGSGRSRFKLPTIPLPDLPPALKLTEELGRAELAREEATTLLVRPAFAASTEVSRFYLNGILLHDDEDGALTAVATDGHRLVTTRVPGAAGLSADFKLIVPNAALKICGKLLGDKGTELVTLCRSQTLFAFESAKATFISKLIDGKFPDYTKLVPKPSGSAVTVDRAELMQALTRASAVVGGKQRAVVGLAWGADEEELQVCLADSEAADDVVNAEFTGSGKVAVQIGLLAELLDALDGARVCLDSRDDRSPVLVTDPDDADLLALQMPCLWSQAQAA
jgi:DNA polymerase-3 subunit beta